MFDKIVIPEQVYNEVMFENTPSYIKENFLKLREGFVEIYEFELGSPQFSAYRNIKKGYWSVNGAVCGDGEASAMALAHVNGGVVASNNLSDVVEYISRLNFELITSSMILSKAFEKGIVSKDEADSLWDAMLKDGQYLPCGSFKKYYEEIYLNDCDDFLRDGWSFLKK